MISTLNGWSRLDHERAGLGRRHLAQLERMVGGDALAHPRLDGREVVRGERTRQQEVVVEAVVDDGADAELGAGEQVHHRLGEDVRGGMAHRAELAARAVIHELGGASRARARRDRSRSPPPSPLRCPVPGPSVRPPRESRNPSSIDRTRGFLSRSHPPSPPTGGALVGRAIGRLPGRFAGRSRVVPARRRPSGSQPGPDSLEIRSARCVPLDALFVLWWATLDSNQ